MMEYLEIFDQIAVQFCTFAVVYPCFCISGTVIGLSRLRDRHEVVIDSCRRQHDVTHIALPLQCLK